MRVLFASHAGRLGGAELSLLELMQELSSKGIAVSLVCAERSPLASAAVDAGVELFPVRLQPLHQRRELRRLVQNGAQVTSAVMRVVGLLRREQFDLVHANTTIAQLWAGPAARIAGVPSVWHWRDFYDIRWLNRLLATTADVVIAVSEAVREFAVSQLGREDKVRVVVNGVQDRWPDRQAPASSTVRQGWGMTQSDLLVALLGQAIPRKGHEILVRAMAGGDLPPEVKALLFVAPDGGNTAFYLAGLRNLVRALRCEDRVKLVEERQDATTVLPEVDIVAVPSLREPFGRVAVEGMLAGRPVIASDIDGLRSIVVDGGTGQLVAPGDPQDLARAISSLAGRPELRAQLGRAGRRRALDRFSITRTAEEVLQVYQRLTASAPPGRSSADVPSR